jgi:hypothetical protein
MNVAKLLLVSVLATSASTALADSRAFIVANQPDGYGIDQCLASGDRCGAPAARAYCEANNFKTASSYRRMEPDEVTGAIPASAGRKCSGGLCAADYVVITCER